MLAAHLVPGYFAAKQSEANWSNEWTKPQRVLLWGVALGSTVFPDFDVILNIISGSGFYHSTLWTHSVFVYLLLALIWLILYLSKRLHYIRTLFGLAALGGLSHLVLDMIAHNTPLLYPFSMRTYGIASQWVVHGGLWAYLTDPMFALEPVLFCVAIIHFIWQRKNLPPDKKKLATAILTITSLIALAVFMALIPTLQQTVKPLLPI